MIDIKKYFEKVIRQHQKEIKSKEAKNERR